MSIHTGETEENEGWFIKSEASNQWQALPRFGLSIECSVPLADFSSFALPAHHSSALFLPRQDANLYLTEPTVQNELFPCLVPCLSLAARSCLVPELSYSSSSSEINRAGSCAAHPTSLCATQGGKIFQQGLDLLLGFVFFSVNTSKKRKKNKI